MNVKKVFCEILFLLGLWLLAMTPCAIAETQKTATKSTVHPQMSYKGFEEQILFSTVRIVVDTDDPNRQSIGTGFLFKLGLKEYPDQSVILLVSNKHVFGDKKHKMLLKFHKKNVDDTPLLGSTFDFYDKIPEQEFIEHPDPNVDLACVNISEVASAKYQIFMRPVGDDMASKFDEEELVPGGDVWFIGYPDNRFDFINNLPIMRRGYIASAPKVNFNGMKQFIIDAQVFPGSSGSPVFWVFGGKAKFLGVVKQTMIKNGLLKEMPASTAYGVEQVIGLGIVEKSDLVIELAEVALKRASDKYKEIMQARDK